MFGSHRSRSKNSEKLSNLLILLIYVKTSFKKQEVSYKILLNIYNSTCGLTVCRHRQIFSIVHCKVKSGLITIILHTNSMQIWQPLLINLANGFCNSHIQKKCVTCFISRITEPLADKGYLNVKVSLENVSLTLTGVKI